MGLSFATHYCGGQAVKSSLVIGSTTVDCGMESKDNSCESHQASITKKSCCDNQSVSFSTEDEFKPSTNPLNVEYKLVCAYVHAFIAPLIFKSENNVLFVDFSPPIRNKNLQVLLQSFLL